MSEEVKEKQGGNAESNSKSLPKPWQITLADAYAELGISLSAFKTMS